VCGAELGAGFVEDAEFQEPYALKVALVAQWKCARISRLLSFVPRDLDLAS